MHPHGSPTRPWEDLVLRARGGDHDAFTALARTTSDRLFAIAIRILRDRSLAEDAVQEALIEVWRNIRALREADRFEAWATRILVRICYREARRTRATLSLLEDSQARSADAYRNLDDRDQLERGFSRLVPQQRVVLVMRHYLGMEPAEIASTLGMPQGTVRSRLHYALEALRAALEADARSSEPLEVIE